MPLISISQVNAGIIRKDLARIGESRAALQGVVRAVFIGCRTVRGGVKRRDGEIAAAITADARHLLEAIHFEILRPVAIGQDVILDVAPVQLDTAAGLGKEIDYRRAVEAKLRCIERILQDRLHAIQQQCDLDFAR